MKGVSTKKNLQERGVSCSDLRKADLVQLCVNSLAIDGFPW